MKLSNNYKTVMFYGRILCVKSDASYFAANADGEIYTYNIEPTCMDIMGIWSGEGASSTGVVITFDVCESWKDTLTYCEGKGQEWMLDLKTKIAVEYALLQNGAILRQKALCNVMEASPFVESFIQPQWEGFRKHSGVENVAGNDFLDALKAEMKPASPLFIEAEKRSCLGDGCLLIRVYYGAELIIPEWTRFIAMDNDGMVWGYEEQPEVDRDGDWTNGGRGRARNVGWRGRKTGGKECLGSLRKVQS